MSRDRTLDGTAGNNDLVGGMGNDELRGSVGDDELIGNEGNDTYFGGEGRDRMVLVGGGTDTVSAFELTNDTLDFQGAFANAEEFAAAASFRRGAAVIEVPGGGTVIVQGRKPGDLVPGVNVSL